MRAIQCFSSRPMQNGRQASGHYAGQHNIALSETLLMCMKLSALQWRITNGPIKLYTDTPMKEYLEKKNLLICWDSVDTEVLDNFYQDCDDIDFRVFWSAGKFACFQSEKAPFVCIDTDLIVWKRLSFDPKLDFAFAHWEMVEPEDESYPEISQIQRPADYIEDPPAKFFHPRAYNMAITYFGNDSMRERFSRKALSFMRKNYVKAGDQYALPEILYVEQRLPYAIALQKELYCAPVLPCMWNPKKFRIMHPGRLFRNWFFSDLNKDMPFTHLWFHKKYLSENEIANASYCEALRGHIEHAGKPGAAAGGTWSVPYMVCEGKGCSKCSNSMWIHPDDPDYSEWEEFTRGGLRILYCPLCAYYQPTPPYYNMTLPEHSSIISD